jgi:O-antigen/teichoic acid export membrane protein
LGFYSRADSTLALPNNFTSGIINQVAMPLFSAANHDPELLHRAFRKAMRVTFYVHAPIIVCLFVSAEPLVLTLFGQKWAPAIPYLEVLAFCGLFWLPVTVNYAYLKATGRSKSYFHIELIKKVLYLGIALATVRISIMAMVFGGLAFALIAYIITAQVAGGKSGYGGLRQIQDSWRPLLAAAAIIPVAALPLLVHGLPPAIALALQLLSGSGSYVLFCRLFSCQEQNEFFAHFRSFVYKARPIITASG